MRRREDDVRSRAYRLGGITFLIFIVTAIVGSIVGSFLDQKYQLGITGKVTSLMLTYIVAWIAVAALLKKYASKSD